MAPKKHQRTRSCSQNDVAKKEQIVTEVGLPRKYKPTELDQLTKTRWPTNEKLRQNALQNEAVEWLEGGQIKLRRIL